MINELGTQLNPHWKSPTRADVDNWVTAQGILMTRSGSSNLVFSFSHQHATSHYEQFHTRTCTVSLLVSVSSVTPGGRPSSQKWQRRWVSLLAPSSALPFFRPRKPGLEHFLNHQETTTKHLENTSKPRNAVVQHLSPQTEYMPTPCPPTMRRCEPDSIFENSRAEWDV
ncbi:hypothetical protein N658DRAFT_322229 [Parathielavia hyrcaniae]|uniref:Uncharacterized protein n=1 Tax=Parathielavia hyrcaniae TaxID=113614 RepID=A0AAN6Q5S4_9PEZI|nr:hypothetical protein N658DRAFT_322229 [Parathielavia hyrcaniae]